MVSEQAWSNLKAFQQVRKVRLLKMPLPNSLLQSPFWWVYLCADEISCWTWLCQDSSSPSIDTFKSLSNVLRNRLQPLFVGYLPATLNYVVAVLKFIHYEKVVPILQSERYNQPNLWEPLATSAISGVLVCITSIRFFLNERSPFRSPGLSWKPS